jgi:hypothetical protein
LQRLSNHHSRWFRAAGSTAGGRCQQSDAGCITSIAGFHLLGCGQIVRTRIRT